MLISCLYSLEKEKETNLVKILSNKHVFAPIEWKSVVGINNIVLKMKKSDSRKKKMRVLNPKRKIFCTSFMKNANKKKNLT